MIHSTMYTWNSNPLFLEDKGIDSKYIEWSIEERTEPGQCLIPVKERVLIICHDRDPLSHGPLILYYTSRTISTTYKCMFNTKCNLHYLWEVCSWAEHTTLGCGPVEGRRSHTTKHRPAGSG